MKNVRTVLACCLFLSSLASGGCSDKKKLQREAPSRTQETANEQQLAQEGARKQRQAAESLNMSVNMRLNLGREIKMKLVLIPAGRFLMGSPETETSREADEGPQHEVVISKPFYMGICEVTQAQWREVMGTEPWVGKYLAKPDPNNPVSWITWNDAMEFCVTLSKITGKKTTLPTEAQWEYACRSGSTTAYYFGDDASRLGDYAWCEKNAFGKGVKPLSKDATYTRPVGRKRPNAFGLYDMHGNVWEWCQDWYDEEFYTKGKKADPVNVAKATSRIFRGGAWFNSPNDCRSAIRFRGFADSAYDYVGLRVVIVCD